MAEIFPTPIADMVALLIDLGATKEQIIAQISSMEFSMDSPRRISEKEEAFIREERRKLLDRKRKKEEYSRKREAKFSMENSTEKEKRDIYVEPTYVKTMDVVTMDHGLTIDVTTSRARGKKPQTEFPSDWPNETIVANVMQLGGLSREMAFAEIENMRDWALSKNQKRADWFAFARIWIRKNRNQTNGVSHGNVIAAADRQLERIRQIDPNFGNPRGGTGQTALRLLPQR